MMDFPECLLDIGARFMVNGIEVLEGSDGKSLINNAYTNNKLAYQCGMGREDTHLFEQYESVKIHKVEVKILEPVMNKDKIPAWVEPLGSDAKIFDDITTWKPTIEDIPTHIHRYQCPECSFKQDLHLKCKDGSCQQCGNEIILHHERCACGFCCYPALRGHLFDHDEEESKPTLMQRMVESEKNTEE